MAAGDFTATFKVEGNLAAIPPIVDQVVTYALPAAQVGPFLAGFLRQCPIPLDTRPNATNTGFLNALPDGSPAPMYTALVWLQEWLRQHANGASKRGLAEIAAASITDPVPGGNT